jgi:hypothetical protein
MNLYYVTRELKTRPVYYYSDECQCDERPKGKAEESTCLTSCDTGLLGEREHLTIETRLIDEMFASVMGECVTLTPQVRRRY